MLGLPDLYATTYNPAAFTPGSWSILAHGPYNNEGRTPPNYSAYERSALGWLDLAELDKPADISLNPISSNEGYKITTERPNEYYVFENRQQEGWDKYIPGHGMLVWHIDYDETRWNNNLVNTNASHQYVDIVEADNILTDATVAGDAFPGTRHVTEFTDDTAPSMLSWSGARQNKPITRIEESADGVISFKVMGGKRDLQAAENLRADIVAPTSITLRWTPCQDCDYQLASVYTKTAGGEKQYVDGYKSLRLSADAETLLVSGLVPSTQYFFTLTSCTDYEQLASQEHSAQTLPPSFDMNYYWDVDAENSWVRGVSVDDSQYESKGLYGLLFACDPLPAGVAGRSATIWLKGKGVTASTPVILLQGEATLTGIGSVMNSAVQRSGKTFNMSGQQVDSSYKGMVIKDGKKFFVK